MSENGNVSALEMIDAILKDISKAIKNDSEEGMEKLEGYVNEISWRLHYIEEIVDEKKASLEQINKKTQEIISEIKEKVKLNINDEFKKCLIELQNILEKLEEEIKKIVLSREDEQDENANESPKGHNADEDDITPQDVDKLIRDVRELIGDEQTTDKEERTDIKETNGHKGRRTIRGILNEMMKPYEPDDDEYGDDEYDDDKYDDDEYDDEELGFGSQKFGGRFRAFAQYYLGDEEPDEEPDEEFDDDEQESNSHRPEIEVKDEEIQALFDTVSVNEYIKDIQQEFVRLNTFLGENKDDFCIDSDRIIASMTEVMNNENIGFEEFKIIFEIAKKDGFYNGTNVVMQAIIENFLNKAIEMSKEKYSDKKEEILSATEIEKEPEEILEGVRRRIKALAKKQMSRETSKEVLDAVVLDIEQLIEENQISSEKIEEILQLYYSNIQNTQRRGIDEYIELAFANMTQEISDKESERTESEAEKSETDTEGTISIEEVNEKLQRILEQLNEVVAEAEKGNAISEQSKKVNEETKKILQTQKLSIKQIGNLVDCYKKAGKKLKDLEKQPEGTSIIIEEAEDLEAKYNAYEKNKPRNEQISKEKEAELAEITKKIQEKIKSRKEIDKILEKYKTKINKFVSSYKKILKIQKKYANTNPNDIYNKLTAKIRIEEEKIKAEKRKIEEYKKELEKPLTITKINKINKKIKKCDTKINKIQKNIKAMEKDIRIFNNAFKLMKKIRTEINQEVNASEKWLPFTKECIAKNTKNNNDFYRFAQGRTAETNLIVSEQEQEMFKQKVKEVRAIRSDGAVQDNGRTNPGADKDVRHEPRAAATETGIRWEKENAEKATKDGKKGKGTKKKDKRKKIDPYKKIEYSFLSEKDKKREAFKYYKANSESKVWGTIRAFIKSRTKKGRREWEKQFFETEETMDSNEAKKYRQRIKEEYETKEAGRIMSGAVVKRENGKVTGVEIPDAEKE